MQSIYCKLNDGTDELPNNLLAGMLRLRYGCNPDFEQQYPSVVQWYAEINTETGFVIREIGLDHAGTPIVVGPFGRNDGVWTAVSMSSRVFDDETPRIAQGDFEVAWAVAETRYRDVVRPKRIEPRVPVADPEQILGSWAASMVQGPGSMCDNVIQFVADGTGFFSDYNGCLMYFHEFDWKILEFGLLTIAGRIAYYQDDNLRIVESPSDFQYDAVSIEMQTHCAATGTSIDVLYLPLRTRKHGWLSNVYGRCPVPASDVRRPEFF